MRDDLTSTHAVADTARRWYVLQCKPRECERAVAQLANQGYVAFCPTLRREAVRRGQRAVVIEPLFPHYIFVQLSATHDNWAPIRSTRGVAKVLRFGDLPVAVPEAIVTALQAREVGQDGGEQAPTALFTTGQRVQISDGPLAGLEAVIAARDGTERVVLLLKLLHQEQRVTVPMISLKASS